MIQPLSFNHRSTSKNHLYTSWTFRQSRWRRRISQILLILLVWKISYPSPGAFDVAFQETRNKGSFCRVIRALWKHGDGREVALKVLVGSAPPTSFRDETELLRKLRETIDAEYEKPADTAHTALHVGLKRLCYPYCAGREEDGSKILRESMFCRGAPLPFVAMEPLEHTLRERMITSGKLKPGEALVAAADIMAALAALHAMKIVHGDMK